MTVLSCPHCGAFHVVLNGPPRNRVCIDCGGWMDEVDSVAEACAISEQVRTARRGQHEDARQN